MKNFQIFKRTNKTIFELDNIKILVTDSGIGGLSVVDDLYNFFKNNHYYNHIEIIYANCRNGKIGYNEITNVDQKIKLFSDKLTELYENIQPDIIFIACNTLSVLYNKTQFYKNHNVVVIDICQTGLNLIQQSLNRNECVFILGTQTTIKQNYYKNNLLETGFDKNQIINQLCPNLAKYIQYSYIYPYQMKYNVKWLTNRILEKKPKQIKKYAISFNCTHYYYALKYFKRYFNDVKENPQFICPNFNIKDKFVQYLQCDRFVNSKVQILIYQPNIKKRQMLKILYFLQNKKNLYFFKEKRS